MLRFFGIAILCAAATAFLRETKSPLYRMLPAVGGVCILAYAVSSVGQSVTALEGLAEGTAVSDYVGTLLRALGIGYASELTADVCRSCGADQPANSILLLGRAELVALACPLLAELLGAAASVLV